MNIYLYLLKLRIECRLFFRTRCNNVGLIYTSKGSEHIALKALKMAVYNITLSFDAPPQGSDVNKANSGKAKAKVKAKQYKAKAKARGPQGQGQGQGLIVQGQGQGQGLTLEG